MDSLSLSLSLSLSMYIVASHGHAVVAHAGKARLDTQLCVRILLYMCPHTAIYVSSHYYMCPPTFVCMCPHTGAGMLYFSRLDLSEKKHAVPRGKK